MMKVAIVQCAPEYLDLEKSLQKALVLIKEAAEKGSSLVVFGETWLCGYPAWLDHCPGAALWNDQATKEVFAQTYENALLMQSPEMGALQEAAAALGVAICMGFNEKIAGGMASGTLYNSLVLINAEGNIVVHHRKLVPTFSEKMVYGLGDGHGLRSADLAGVRVGALICWEHWMPLTRQSMHETGEQLHIALWPAVNEMHQIASRQYAFEGRCFVIAAGQILRAGDFPSELQLPAQWQSDSETLVLGGGSCVIGPDGSYLLEPVFGKEAILEVSLDIRETIKEKMTLDVTGHYQRNDVFQFNVNKERKA